ncbi:hypothetical protein F2Q68_00036591 [Brassica cretica]|uniref:Uncharacterized protein n=1 Tax=Brassica cretica TaxID=69181 RepID=A0A8S9H2B9_BRACR|nr:hypothetical protein F2Q68_00036591 [Brassica cretica]
MQANPFQHHSFNSKLTKVSHFSCCLASMTQNQLVGKSGSYWHMWPICSFLRLWVGSAGPFTTMQPLCLVSSNQLQRAGTDMEKVLSRIFMVTQIVERVLIRFEGSHHSGLTIIHASGMNAMFVVYLDNGNSSRDGENFDMVFGLGRAARLRSQTHSNWTAPS